MRAFTSVLLALSSLTIPCYANEAAKARLLESEGNTLEARAALQSAANAQNPDPEDLQAWAEFLDRHRDPEARPAYEKLLSRVSGQRANQVARRLVVLDLIANDRESAMRHLKLYSQTGGSDITPASLGQAQAETLPQANVSIPGPLRSFARMAALSPDLSPNDLLTALARNVVTNGYQASSSNEALDQTEYLKLVFRYLSQARELEKLAAANGNEIKIDSCESTQTADLLRVLGYRMRGGCGTEVVLETVNATRAFLTIDSGFPLAELEQALRVNRPFVYDFKPTQVPVLYGVEFWLSARDKPEGEFIDIFLSDPALCRLYLGLAKLDPETAEEMKKQMPLPRLRAFAHVLDFYGGMFQIRKGVATVPGGEKAWPQWQEVVGASPKEGAVFFEKLITRDDGWMASYYDALARISGSTQDYLLDSKRMGRYYSALRGRITSPGPARPVFRASTDLMMLTQRLRLEADGRPHIPGNLEVWKNLFIKHPHGKYDGKLTKLANGWKEPDDLIEALFALCRKAVENEPLKVYLALSDMNRFRKKPLEPATVDRLAREYRAMGAQYHLFSESPDVSDATILQFMDVAEAVSDIRDQALRADASGTVQALVGLWQIFVRQGSISPSDADATLSSLLGGFLKVRDNADLFDTGRAGVTTLLKATATKPGVSPHDRFIDLLAGSGVGAGAESDTHRRVVEGLIQTLESQRLVTLDTLFQLADHLEALGRGEKLDTALIARLASRISEIQLPRASLTSVEKNSLAFGYWTEKHVEMQRKANLRAAIEKAKSGPDKLNELRGLLSPFLRDTLVGFNYAHYAPPGGQLLRTNPLFVRTHDFLGIQGSPQTWRATEVFGTGWPSSAGGRLVGSLAGLPYALAEAEQNFLIPTREQALIWGDLVPQLMLAAKIPRWWQTKPAQLHWISLHMNQGESLIAEAALEKARRNEVLDLLEQYAPPARLAKVTELVDQCRVADALDFVMPSELFLIAADWWSAHKDDNGMLSAEARRLMKDHPGEVSYAAISRSFGTPKPVLANSYRPELSKMRTFPTLMGYSSRIMAESWESNLLYYAAVAHEVHLPPQQLNIAVPEWTQQTVEKIFATHLEDWPALLRSLRLVGDEIRAKARKQLAAEQKASLK
jgi:hypothetical protein